MKRKVAITLSLLISFSFLSPVYEATGFSNAIRQALETGDEIIKRLGKGHAEKGLNDATKRRFGLNRGLAQGFSEVQKDGTWINSFKTVEVRHERPTNQLTFIVKGSGGSVRKKRFPMDGVEFHYVVDGHIKAKFRPIASSSFCEAISKKHLNGGLRLQQNERRTAAVHIFPRISNSGPNCQDINKLGIGVGAGLLVIGTTVIIVESPDNKVTPHASGK